MLYITRDASNKDTVDDFLFLITFVVSCELNRTAVLNHDDVITCALNS